MLLCASGVVVIEKTGVSVCLNKNLLDYHVMGVLYTSLFLRSFVFAGLSLSMRCAPPSFLNWMGWFFSIDVGGDMFFSRGSRFSTVFAYEN